MAYGTPARPDEIEAVLHRHPPRPAADARAAGRPGAPLRRHRRPVAARRRAPRRSARRCSAALDERPPGPRSRSCSAEARRADDRGRRRRRWAPAASAAPSGWCWPRTTRRVASASTSTRAEAAAAGGPASPRPASSAGTCAGLRRRSRPPRWPTAWPRCPPGHEGAVHRPLAAGRASSPSGDPYPDELRGHGRRGGRGRAGLAPWSGWGVGLAVGRPHAGAVARPRHPGGDRRAGRRRAPRACSCARCGFVADHLEVLYDLDIEAARPGRRRAGWPSPAPPCVNDDPAVLGALADLVLAGPA